MQQVRIDLGDRSYDIAIGAGLLADTAAFEGLPRAAAALIVTNSTVQPLYAKQLRAAIAPHYGLYEPTTNAPIPHAHNIALTLGAERGLLGIVGFLWLLVALVRVVIRGARRTSGFERGLVTGVAAALLAISVKGLFDYDIGNHVVAATLFLMAGFAVVLSRGPMKAEPPQPSAL